MSNMNSFRQSVDPEGYQPVLQTDTANVLTALQNFRQANDQRFTQSLHTVFDRWNENLSVPGRLTNWFLRYEGDIIEEQTVNKLATLARQHESIPLKVLLLTFEKKVREEERHGNHTYRISPGDIDEIVGSLAVVDWNQMGPVRGTSTIRRLRTKAQAMEATFQNGQRGALGNVFAGIGDIHPGLANIDSQIRRHIQVVEHQSPRTANNRDMHYQDANQGELLANIKPEVATLVLQEQKQENFCSQENFEKIWQFVKPKIQGIVETNFEHDFEGLIERNQELLEISEARISEKLTMGHNEREDIMRINSEQIINKIKEELLPEFRTSLVDDLQARSTDSVFDKVMEKMNNRIEEMKPEINNQIKHGLKEDLTNQIQQAARREVLQQMQKAIEPELKEELVKILKESISNDVLTRLIGANSPDSGERSSAACSINQDGSKTTSSGNQALVPTGPKSIGIAMTQGNMDRKTEMRKRALMRDDIPVSQPKKIKREDRRRSVSPEPMDICRQGRQDDQVSFPLDRCWTQRMCHKRCTLIIDNGPDNRQLSIETVDSRGYTDTVFLCDMKKIRHVHHDERMLSVSLSSGGGEIFWLEPLISIKGILHQIRAAGVSAIISQRQQKMMEQFDFWRQRSFRGD